MNEREKEREAGKSEREGREKRRKKEKNVEDSTLKQKKGKKVLFFFFFTSLIKKAISCARDLKVPGISIFFPFR